MKFVADRYGFDRLLTAYHGGSLEAAGLDSAQVGRECWRCSRRRQSPNRRDAACCASMRANLCSSAACPNEVEEAWRHAQRSGERSNDEVEADYRAVMALSGDCRPLGSLADRYHRRGDAKAQRRIEDELIQRGLSSAQAATLFERRADEAIAAADASAASAHLRRLAAAPAEHRYRGLLVRASWTEEHPELVRAVAPYLTTGAGAEAVSARPASGTTLPAPAAAALRICSCVTTATEATLEARAMGLACAAAPAHAQPRDRALPGAARRSPQQALPGGCPLAVAGAASAGCC